MKQKTKLRRICNKIVASYKGDIENSEQVFLRSKAKMVSLLQVTVKNESRYENWLKSKARNMRSTSLDDPDFGPIPNIKVN